jgi:hypothetical protein
LRNSRYAFALLVGTVPCHILEIILFSPLGFASTGALPLRGTRAPAEASD